PHPVVSGFPPSMWTSCSITRATRRSHKVCEARSIEAAAAFSHGSLLVPISSIILYTLSAIVFSFRSVPLIDYVQTASAFLRHRQLPSHADFDLSPKDASRRV